MPIPSSYGANYSRFFIDDGSPVPFPQPANESQRAMNARVRAERAGVSIGSGYLNPSSGDLQDPDRGFMRYIAEHPYLGAAISLGPALPFAFGGGGAGGATAPLGAKAAVPTSVAMKATPAAIASQGASASVAGAGGLIPSASVPIGSAMSGPAAIGSQGASNGVGAATTAGTIANTTSAATSALQKLRDRLTSPESIAALASLIPAIVASRSGSGGGSSPDVQRINAITEARMRRADPLHEVATQLAFSRAPIAARDGISLPRVPLP